MLFGIGSRSWSWSRVTFSLTLLIVATSVETTAPIVSTLDRIQAGKDTPKPSLLIITMMVMARSTPPHETQQIRSKLSCLLLEWCKSRVGMSVRKKDQLLYCCRQGRVGCDLSTGLGLRKGAHLSDLPPFLADCPCLVPIAHASCPYPPLLLLPVASFLFPLLPTGRNNLEPCPSVVFASATTRSEYWSVSGSSPQWPGPA